MNLKASVSHAKHRQIREICEIRVPYKDIENRELSGLLEELKHTDLTDHTDFCLRQVLDHGILGFLMRQKRLSIRHLN